MGKVQTKDILPENLFSFKRGSRSRTVAITSSSEMAILTLKVTKRCGYHGVANFGCLYNHEPQRKQTSRTKTNT